MIFVFVYFYTVYVYLPATVKLAPSVSTTLLHSNITQHHHIGVILSKLLGGLLLPQPIAFPSTPRVFLNA